MTIEARLTDITMLDVDAIVNAANSELAQGSGVCGAIFRAAGPDLGPACEQVKPCPPGDARITPGFALPARYVIHAVGPIWHGGHAGERDLLVSAYRASMRLAREHDLKTIAFPAVSTGVFGYPLDAATRVAASTVRRELDEPGSITRVVFACIDANVLRSYTDAGVATGG